MTEDELINAIGAAAAESADALELPKSAGAIAVLLGAVLCVLSEDQQKKVLAILKAQGDALKAQVNAQE